MGIKIGILSSASISCLASIDDFFTSETGIINNEAKLAPIWENQLPALKNSDRVTQMAVLAARLAISKFPHPLTSLEEPHPLAPSPKEMEEQESSPPSPLSKGDGEQESSPPSPLSEEDGEQESSPPSPLSKGDGEVNDFFSPLSLRRGGQGVRIGVCIGSSRGATETFENLFQAFLTEGKVPPMTSPMTTLGNISASVAKDLGLSGPVLSHSSTCSTGLQAIGNAMAWLSSGMADFFIAGASEAPLTDFTKAQMKALKIYAKTDEKYPCQPLSSEARNSMVLGEAASVFVLEKFNESTEYEAVIESYANAMDHQVTATGISEFGFYHAMLGALEHILPSEIDLIIMHAPGTKIGDQAEWNAIHKIWKKIPVYSLKWQTGHSLAASGCLSIQLAISILKKQKIPAFPYSTFIENEIPKKINKILINSAGFGGNTTSLVISLP